MLAAEDFFVQIADYANRLGVVLILIIFIYAVYKRWLVPGWVDKERLEMIAKCERELSAWRETALKASNVAIDAFDELRKRSP